MNTVWADSRKVSTEQGFTLVELLVGVAISLFVTAISFTYLVSSTRTFSQQTNDDIIQENARFALELMTQQLRLAGLDTDAALDEELDVIYTGTICPATDVGIASATAPSNGTPCTRDAVAGVDFASDRLAIDYKVTVPTTNCSGQNITQTMLNNSGGSLTLASIFWIQNVNGIRSLYCQSVDIESRQVIGAGVPLISGIDAMQLQFGRDTNDDGLVDSYVNFTDLANGNPLNPATQTRQVKLVRLSMLISSGLAAAQDGARTDITSSTEQATDKEYRLLDAAPIESDAETVLRQIFTTTVLIPNAQGV